MKILLWPTMYLPNIGGLEIMAHSLALQLKKMGHEIVVIANHSGSEKAKKQWIDGIEVWSFSFVDALANYRLRSIKEMGIQIDAIIDQFRPDVVNVHGWFENFCFFQSRALEKREIPLLITVHGLLEQKNYRTLSCLKLWKMASGINTVSDSILLSLKEMGLDHPLLETIYNGLSISPSPLQPIPFTPPHLFMVGRLSSEKCFEVGFHALKELREKYPQIKLTLVGGGEKFEPLNQLRHSLDLADSIYMSDYIPPHEVEQYIDQATLVVIPSDYESFCLVALQAALRCRPVVASRVYGLKEVVDEGKTGLLVEPKNVEAFVEAIDQLLKSPNKMEEMGLNAYARAKNLFNIQSTAQKYLTMYQTILEKKNVRDCPSS